LLSWCLAFARIRSFDIESLKGEQQGITYGIYSREALSTFDMESLENRSCEGTYTFVVEIS